MNIDTLKDKIRYLTNEEEKKTDVLIPLAMGENILQNLPLEIEEENDHKTQLIANLKQSLLHAREGKTYPLEQLCNDN
ncbi:MAG: hypothetical protein GW795_15245 [Cyanobacteria bacterium]|nr:hypothetical protein [Cyanobacteria bacterium CG_2015-16_32_12]NCO77048.1 hypothetical protein [Cyanobacteria bacterium CG_2015-22_32_23]NCQ03702.1 hypothetical protein [Cyanobacteria bacterium CG_2015-09_32_10]NCQ43182.1 hypothetical protein [Cyanobacteria bacterium CG_2015-04_32_10]